MVSREIVTLIDGRLRVIQIVLTAILAGASIFSIVVAITVDWNLLNSDIKLLTLGGAATGFMMLGMAMIVPRLMTASSAQIAAQLVAAQMQTANGDEVPVGRIDADQVEDAKIIDALIENLFSNRIIFSAIVEAAIFLNLIVFQIEVSVVSIFMVALGLAMLIVTFPLRFRLMDWLEQNTTDVRRELELMN